MNENKGSHNDYQKSAGFFLDAAADALNSGHKGLAVHLYRAAFEVSHEHDLTPARPVIEGLRKAWALACERNDRCTAEAIFGDLTPYNSPEEMEKGVVQLQELAVSQLEEMGLSKENLEGMAQAVTEGMISSGGSDLMDTLKSTIERMEETSGSSVIANKTIEETHPSQAAKTESNNDMLVTYADIAGYEGALHSMRAYGFESAGDVAYRAFVHQASRMHGIEGLSLMDSFLFYGPSPEDVSLFARATAGEIGWPMITMHADLDEQGNGSIKLGGPFKKSLFGPPDLTEVPMPCVLLIENIDSLQDMFSQENKASLQVASKQQNPRGRSIQGEVMAYLKTLLDKQGVFVIATAKRPDCLKDALLSLIGPVQEIAVELPTECERREVWTRFAVDHPSFVEFDFDDLSRLSEGVSRRDLVVAGRAAVESAYRASLRSGVHQKVFRSDVLAELAPFVQHDGPAYQRLEDAAVEQMRKELEDDNFSNNLP